MQGVIAVSVVFGLLALLLSLSRWLAHRPWAAAGNLAVALALLLASAWLWPPVQHFRTYAAMRPKALVAQVHSERTGPSSYRVTLTRLPDGHMEVFEMSGDEFRLNSRTLVWMGHAAKLGLPPSYRLDRLSGRYVHASADKSPAAATSYALSDPDEPGADIWAQARTESSFWRARIDARHAYGPWRPLADGARYDIALRRLPGQPEAVLEARPANEAAAKAMRYTKSVNVRTKG